MSFLVIAALVAAAIAIPLVDVPGTYIPTVSPTCRLNYLTLNPESYEAQTAICLAQTTKDDCEGNNHCWWDDAVATNLFAERDNGLWELGNQTYVTPLPGVHTMYGFGGITMAFCTIVETDNYVILINAGQSTAASLGVKQWIATHIGKPIRYLIITHAHPDEMMDSASIYTPGQPLTIITPLGVFQDLALQQAIAPLQLNPPSLPGANLIRNFGLTLPRDTDWRMSGPLMVGGSALLCSYGPFVFPTVPGVDCNYLTTLPTTLTLDGLTVTFLSTPADLPNQISLYFPSKKFLFASDVIMAMFPAVSTYRGDPVRPVDKWISSMQTLLKLQLPPNPGWEWVSASSVPLLGYPKSLMAMNGFLSILQSVQAHVISGIKNNVAPEDIETSYVIPDYVQAQLAPFYPLFQETYHHIGLTIRGAIIGYIGAAGTTWSGHRRVPLARKWADLITLAGGAEHAVLIAKRAVAAGTRDDLLFALEIGEALKGTNSLVADAKLILYQSGYMLGLMEQGLTARNFYLSCAWQNKPTA